MGRKPRDKQRKKDLPKTERWLLDLLPKLQDLSVHKLTMDELAGLVGKSKSTLYEYFTSKEEILLEMAKVRIKQLDAFRTSVDLNSIEVLETYIAYITLFANGISELSVQFLNEMRDYFPSVWEQIQLLNEKVITDLSGLYQRGIDEGIFKKVSLDWLIAMDTFFVSRVITDSSVFSQDQVKLNQLIEEYVDIRLNGLVEKA